MFSQDIWIKSCEGNVNQDAITKHLKFGYSEKATKFEKKIPLKIWCYSVTSNFKLKIFSNFVAFSEYPSFKKNEFALIGSAAC